MGPVDIQTASPGRNDLGSTRAEEDSNSSGVRSPETGSCPVAQAAFALAQKTAIIGGDCVLVQSANTADTPRADEFVMVPRESPYALGRRSPNSDTGDGFVVLAKKIRLVGCLKFQLEKLGADRQIWPWDEKQTSSG